MVYSPAALYINPSAAAGLRHGNPGVNEAALTRAGNDLHPAAAAGLPSLRRRPLVTPPSLTSRRLLAMATGHLHKGDKTVTRYAVWRRNTMEISTLGS